MISPEVSINFSKARMLSTDGRCKTFDASANGYVRGEISYLEVHGTGTALGDPIEVGALGAVFGDHSPKDQPLTIASVKTNIGHLEAATGIVGLIKVVLQMQHQEIAPHLHFQQPSPHIDWENLPLIS